MYVHILQMKIMDTARRYSSYELSFDKVIGD